STRQVAEIADQATAVSLGKSGDITFNAVDITLGNAADPHGSAGLFANGQTHAGNIDLTVSQLSGVLPGLPILLLNNSVTGITVNSATVMGDNVTLLADSEHAAVLANDPVPSQLRGIINGGLGFVTGQLQFLGALVVSRSDAEINLGSGSSIQAGN